MGASVSQTSVDVVNNSIISAIVSNVNQCSISTSQTQVVDLSGVGIGTSVSQSAVVSAQCLQNIQITNSMLSQMAQQIQSDATANGVALLPSFTGSQNLSNLTNYLSASVKTESIQKCAVDAVQSQAVSTSGFQIGASATQTLDVVSKCIQSVLNNNNVSQGIVQDVSQTTDSTSSNPLDIFGGFTSIIIIGIIAFIVLIILIAMLFRSGGSTTMEMPELSELPLSTDITTDTPLPPQIQPMTYEENPPAIETQA